MWIVTREWNGYEADVVKFPTKEAAEEYFESQMEETSAQMYLAKVEKTFNDYQQEG
ncbi:hypothetical protein [Lederbergia lenta]|uniref:hypothetical protein n=1 Tax=Lederbergia lenta TaxID=1467 RepID=UPI0020424B4C|nr:hypothetical protein [Lederbergia lenta]MCM3110663.1 hypothetical protein [Lederbergia lenta]